ncbi:MAG: alpha/beta hydrolase-fold protein [Gammaproteobacteria bacterium]|jgi:phospholipase/carboxylesterase|nr:alpha/beta hydrolase-fold protein [Gammaproteobacteria bacterium]
MPAPELPLELMPKRRPAASVIWLHGLGADAGDLLPAAEQLMREASHPLHVVLPRAPIIAVTRYGRVRLRAWFDVVDDGFDRRARPADLDAAVAEVHRLVRREIERGLPGRRILLAGFSQGAAVALHAALRHAGELLGVAALSGYLPLRDALVAAAVARPVFLAHAADDVVVPLAVAESARDWLVGRGHEVTWWPHASGHAVTEAEVSTLAAWVDTAIGVVGTGEPGR